MGAWRSGPVRSEEAYDLDVLVLKKVSLAEKPAHGEPKGARHAPCEALVAALAYLFLPARQITYVAALDFQYFNG